MLTIDYPWNMADAVGHRILFYGLLVYGAAFFLTLGGALTRKDLDPVTRLMWVLVVILVPLGGVVLYLALAPSRFTPKSYGKYGSPRRATSDTLGTPWEGDPGHVPHPKT